MRPAKLAHQVASTGYQLRKGKHLLIAFIALCQSRSSSPQCKTGHLSIPRFGLGPWLGAQVACQQSLILRPGRLNSNGRIETFVDLLFREE
jgi:hypothetical protein